MVKKQIAWMLAAFLTVGTITACAGQGQTSEAAAAAAGSTEAGTSSATDGAVSAAGSTASEIAAAGSTAADEAAATAGTTATAGDAADDQEIALVPSIGATASTAGTASNAGTASTAEVAPAVEPVPGPDALAPAKRFEDSAKDLLPGFTYTRSTVHEVGGRQGIACENGEYWVSGNNTLTRYDQDWKPVMTNADPFRGLETAANRMGDIDVYKGDLYVCAENYKSGEASDIQIAVYDAQTLQLTRSYTCNAESGQVECSGIAVDPDTRSIWLCSWADGKSGRYLYRYSLLTGRYIGKKHMQAVPQWLQGLTYYDGYLYMTADDGTADHGEPDHIYRWRVDTGSSTATITLERTLNDVIMVGEVAGLSFDKTQNKLLVCHNRGAQIAAGEVKGYYNGYDREIHEIYVYDTVENDWTIEKGGAASDAAVSDEATVQGSEKEPAEESEAGQEVPAAEPEAEQESEPAREPEDVQETSPLEEDTPESGIEEDQKDDGAESEESEPFQEEEQEDAAETPAHTII